METKIKITAMKIFTYIADINNVYIVINLYCNNKIKGMSYIIDIYGYCDIEFISEKNTLDPIYWGELNNSISLTN